MIEQQKKDIIRFQKDEITTHAFYLRLARLLKDPHNARVLNDMAQTEKGHYAFWKQYSGVDLKPDALRVTFFTLIARLLGLTFAVKLMEKGEAAGAKQYAAFEAVIPGAAQLGRDEEQHEQTLAGMIREDLLAYMGSIVLGLNDALVELTGTLAGLTLALQNGRLVAISGLITGLAAAFSMAASEYLSARADEDPKAGRSALYTGAAYLVTVALLILPYLLIPQNGAGIYISLAVTLTIAVLIILAFNFYISVARDLPFRRRFLEMFVISMGVAALSFGVGLLVRRLFGIDI